MEIPITGFVVHSNDSESGHSHVLFITSWDGKPVTRTHVHPIAGKTSIDVGHFHHYAGKTEPAPSGVPHVHNYHVKTSFDDQHDHIVKGTTGPAIPLPNGGHYHYFEGCTTINGRIPHAHRYGGKTGDEEC
ncbi:hypothetical protein G8C92_26975 [Paenibacillus donghaensis]|uniref:YmaF family protein n=1 Tax=Paenibacillus donghaensis TaxID=414771 RepID=UPI0018839F3C|nr:YmaF family protein [Paenibacillus donghaensis]MBE9917664.1 hypothetical protein [Paenibacillus donghaensis]